MINKVTLIGYVGQDPEIRTLENGTQVGRFSLATNESFKDKEGNWQTQTEWHNVVVWRELADRCQKFTKGQMLYVEGKISYRKYTDKDGVEKNLTDIVASTVRLLEKREKTDPGQEYQEAEKKAHTSSPAQSEEPWQAEYSNAEKLPF